MSTETISGARIVLECLHRLGVKDIFGYPGGAVIPIYDEIYKFLDSVKFDESEVLKLYHALILEFCKENFKGKILSQSGQEVLDSIKN